MKRSWASYAWMPIPSLLAVILVLWAGDFREPYPGPPLFSVILQLCFDTLASMWVVYALARGFLTSPSVAKLLLVCGVMSWGVSSFASSLAIWEQQINIQITIFNINVWVAALCQLLAVAVLKSPKRLRRPSWWLLGGIAGTTSVAILIGVAASRGWTPVFFVQGEGGTLVRYLVLASAVAMFAITGSMMLARPKTQSQFLYFYGLGLLLIAVGMFGVMVQSVWSSVLGWTGRAAQYLGSMYLVLAVYAEARESGAWERSLASGPRDRYMGYALAVAFVAAAAIVRLLVFSSFGSRVMSAAFFPAVILAALYGGRGPGLLAAGLSVLAMNYASFGLDPQLRVRDSSAWVVVGTFLLSSILIAWTAEALLRARVRAETAEAELRSKDRYARLFNAVREGFAHYEAVYREGVLVDLRVVEINPAGVEISGRRAEAQVGKTWREVWPDVNPGLFTIYQQVDETGEPKRFVDDNKLTGRYYDVLVSRAAPGEFVATFVDITERKRTEEALREADRRKDEFLAILAHELRNPLAPIANAVAIMKMAESDKPVMKHAQEVIERQLANMVRLIDDLLDVNRINQNKLRLRLEEVGLAAVIEDALETTRPIAQERQHTVTVDLPPQPLKLRGDRVRLSQVFGNVLANACKFTPKDGRIAIAAHLENDNAIVSIKDNGIGIPAGRLHSVFEMFQQVDASTEQARSGLGIGLALAKQLVELHGGKIEAKSAGPGEGTELLVTLPLVTESSVVERPENVGSLAAPRRILVVEDNADAADTLSVLLKLLGQEVAIATDGEQAVAAAENYRPDTILLYIGLPKLDGYAVCRRIRAQPWAKHVAIIALTGLGQDQDRSRSLQAGFSSFLVKPITRDALMETIANSAALDNVAATRQRAAQPG